MTLVFGLVQRGYSISLACSSLSKEQEAHLREIGVDVILIDLRRLLNPFADINAAIQLYRLLRAGKFSILHTHMSKAALLGGIVGRLARVPVVVNTAHNLGFVALPHRALRILFWFYDKILFGLTMDCVVTVSENLRKAVVNAKLVAVRKVVAITNGIDPTRFNNANGATVRRELGLSDDQCVIGCIARLVWFKGLDTLIEAARTVSERFPHARIVIVGDGPLGDALRHQAASLGLSDYILFLGERTDIPNLFAAFDLFVLPSVSEGMPITILEAMAARCAVVATAVGGVAEVVSDNDTGILTPARDSRRLAEAIISLLDDPGRRVRMAAAGRARFEHEFHAQAMIDATDTLYRTLVASQRLGEDAA